MRALDISPSMCRITAGVLAEYGPVCGDWIMHLRRKEDVDADYGSSRHRLSRLTAADLLDGAGTRGVPEAGELAREGYRGADSGGRCFGLA
jgi:hypothetical protein